MNNKSYLLGIICRLFKHSLVLYFSTFICFLCFVYSASSLKLARNGYPKFPAPVHSCGRRTTHWRPAREPRVVGGEETPHGAVPWQVALRYHGKHRCGGVLISKRILLTAAHCYIENMVVIAGTTDQHESVAKRQYAKVEQGFPHPDYRKLGPYSYDIALLILESPGLRLNENVKPACLTDETPNPGTWCEVSGWGAQDPRAPARLSTVLRSAAVPILSLETCRKKEIYGGGYQPILDNMLCAGHLKGGIDTCGGDSGSPLVCETNGIYELSGIVSWGDGCAKQDRPGVYTNVASFLDWIREIAIENNIYDI